MGFLQIFRGERESHFFRTAAQNAVGFSDERIPFMQEERHMHSRKESCRGRGQGGETAHRQQRLRMQFQKMFPAEKSRFPRGQAKRQKFQRMIRKRKSRDLQEINTVFCGVFRMGIGMFPADEKERLSSVPVEFACDAQSREEMSPSAAAADGDPFEFFHDPDAFMLFFMRIALPFRMRVTLKAGETEEKRNNMPGMSPGSPFLFPILLFCLQGVFPL